MKNGGSQNIKTQITGLHINFISGNVPKDERVGMVQHASVPLKITMSVSQEAEAAHVSIIIYMGNRADTGTAQIQQNTIQL